MVTGAGTLSALSTVSSVEHPPSTTAAKTMRLLPSRISTSRRGLVLIRSQDRRRWDVDTRYCGTERWGASHSCETAYSLGDRLAGDICSAFAERAYESGPRNK